MRAPPPLCTHPPCGHTRRFAEPHTAARACTAAQAPTGAAKGAAYIGCSILGGGLSWLAVFPLDVVKTNVVVIADPAQRPAALQAARRLRSEGALYRGLGATLLRSVPVNTVYLPMFVFINEMLHRDEAP